MRTAPLILACLAVWPLAAQTFRVHVVNSLTGAPVTAANVVAAPDRGARLWGRTDAAGSFTGATQAAGSYLVTVSRRGYRMTSGGMGKMVEVTSGVETDVKIELLPLGVLAGRVLDQYGDPVRHAIVRTEDKTGEYYESYSSAVTDDRGEYRVTEVPPGKHYLLAEFNSTADERNSGNRPRYSWPQTGGLVLYPNAGGIEQALQVEVSAGETVRVNDIRLSIQRAVTISGRIKPPPAVQGPSLSLERAAKLAMSTSPMVQGAAAEADGRFKIEALPGDYILTASDGTTGKLSKPLALTVREKDITGLELELSPTAEIRGRIDVDGPERFDFSKLLLNLGGGPVKVDGNGTFRTSLGGGNAHVVVQGLLEDWYVKSVQVGETEAIITLSPRGARVSITLDRAGAVFVVLLPEGGAVPNVEAALHAQADASGTFTVRQIPPGEYRVFTLDASNWVLMMNPAALLEKYRKTAPLISVAAGERKAMSLPFVRIKLE